MRHESQETTRAAPVFFPEELQEGPRLPVMDIGHLRIAHDPTALSLQSHTQIDIFGCYQVFAKSANALQVAATNKQVASGQPLSIMPLATTQAMVFPDSLDPGARRRCQVR